jgi:hypothetical protein
LAKAKGTVVVDLVKALRKNKPKALTLLPAKLHHYLEERIVIASWYPLEDYIALLRAAGQVLSRDAGPSVYQTMGRSAARSHMAGTYSRFKDKANRQATFTLLSSMYDSGEMKVVDRAPGRAALEYHGFALPTREVCDTFTGYNLERMTLLGFDNPTVHHVSCRANGEPSCRWELEWKGKGEL